MQATVAILDTYMGRNTTDRHRIALCLVEPDLMEPEQFLGVSGNRFATHRRGVNVRGIN
jgi:hypothetical protein